MDLLCAQRKASIPHGEFGAVKLRSEPELRDNEPRASSTSAPQMPDGGFESAANG